MHNPPKKDRTLLILLVPVKQYNLNQCGERKLDDVWFLFPLFLDREPKKASRKRFSKKKKKDSKGQQTRKTRNRETNKLTKI